MPSIVSGKLDIIKVISDDKQKVYGFDFPVGTALGEAYDIISFLKDEIWKRLEENKKAEADKKVDECCKEECKTALHKKEGRTVPKETILPKKEETKKDLSETLLGKNKK